DSSPNRCLLWCPRRRGCVPLSQRGVRGTGQEGMAKKRLGFIGVGRMGDPMARNLLAAGFELTIYDTNAAAIEPLAALGAQVAKSPRDVASTAEVVLVSLPTPDIVKKVALEIASAGRMKIFIDVSTT